jgi:hypothetical protein
MATRLESEIAPDLVAVQAELKSRGQQASAEAVLFSYILDGLTWRALDGARALPSLQMDAEHPYWNGTFWAVYPKQDNMPGTNSRTIGRYELRMMWTPEVLPWFDRLKQIPTGVTTVDEGRDDPIYRHGRHAAQLIASAVLAAKLDDVIPSAGRKQRVLIATHELMWMLLDRENRRLGISPAPVLKTGAKSLQDVAPLIVIVRGGML